MNRFFVSPETLATAPVRLQGAVAHQIARVLRLPVGAEITLLDNSGAAYLARLVAVSPHEATAHVLTRMIPDVEPHVKLTLYQAVPRARKIEWVLQKGTELGISAFVPVISARCQGLTPADLDDEKLERWRRIVVEAAEQSGRVILPTVGRALALADAIAAALQADLALLAAVDERACTLRAALSDSSQPPRSVALLVGPEGGFAPEEVALAMSHGMRSVSLGPRVLRTETAALVAFSAILYALGELG